MSLIRSVAVIGAGTMGAQIAAHFANAGVPSLLMDLTATLAREGLNKARQLKPDPFFTREAVGLIETAGLDRDLRRLVEAAWTLEPGGDRTKPSPPALAHVKPARLPATVAPRTTPAS